LAAGETLRRVLTAAVLIPAVAAVVLYAPTWVVAMLAAVVTLLALREFFQLASLTLRGFAFWTAVCAVVTFVAQILQFEIALQSLSRVRWMVLSPVDAALVVFLLGAGLLVALSAGEPAESFRALAVSSAAMVFLVVPFSFVARLHGAGELGPPMLLFALALVWAGDIAAYFVGRRFGKHKMAPVLSPKKSWEGAIANVAGSGVVAVAFVFLLGAKLGANASVHLVAIAVLANIAGQVGDLVESAYKRAARVKDSGALLPGHGGMLDRIDSLIFAVPVVWAYVWLVG
jgi:phosphatidate cytidylyltransferase